MKVHVLQHVPFEGIGSIVSWLSERNATVTNTLFYESPALPDLKGLDLGIAMGGPMSVNDEAELLWLKLEKRFVREAVQLGLPVVGICLGAQLIAGALGARVYANREKEIGWFEIEATPSSDDVFRFPEKATVFHWHGETFDLPAGAPFAWQRAQSARTRRSRSMREISACSSIWRRPPKAWIPLSVIAAMS